MVAKLIGLEEHLLTSEMLDAWRALPDGLPDLAMTDLNGETGRRLFDLVDERVRLMDEIGMDVQVLSLTAPGTQGLEPAEATPLALRTNDLIAETVRGRSDRFQGFATLPMPDPEAAARELEKVR